MSSKWACSSLRNMEPNPFGEIRAKLTGMEGVINLSSGDPNFPTPNHIIEAACASLREGETHYTMTSGIIELRKKIAEYYKKFNLDIDPYNEIIVTPGSQQALYLLLSSILNPGDEVLIPNPSYTVYSPIVKYLKGNTVYFDLDKENNFHIKEDFESKITEKTKAVLVCSPNNPTGTVLNEKDLEIVSKVANEHELLIISDEIYNEFIWKGNHLTIAANPKNRSRTVIISSFSKTFAMTGWRLGYMVANSNLTSMMLGLQGNMVLCPASFIQRAGIAALGGTWTPVIEMAKEYEKRVDYASKRLNEIDDIKCPKPEGAFYVWPDISKLSNNSIDFCDSLLEKQKVVALAGTHFGTAGEGYIRLALVNPINKIEEAIERIEKFVKKI